MGKVGKVRQYVMFGFLTNASIEMECEVDLLSYIILDMRSKNIHNDRIGLDPFTPPPRYPILYHHVDL